MSTCITLFAAECYTGQWLWFVPKASGFCLVALLRSPGASAGQQSLRCPFSLSGNRLLVCPAPCANRPLGRHVLPWLLRAHANGEILQQPCTFQLQGESARHGNKQHPLAPAPRVCKLLVPVLSVPEFLHACLCLQIRQHLLHLALGHPEQLFPPAQAASLPLCS